MNEDFSTRDWADHHEELSNGIHRAIRMVMDSLKVLNDKQFDAPWRRPVCEQECPTR